MKRLTSILMILFLLSVSVIGTASAATKFSLQIDGKSIDITGPSPFIDSSNRLQLPLSLVQKALKVKLGWENERKEAYFYVPKEYRPSSSYVDSWLFFKVGRKSYTFEYNTYPMDTAPINKNGSIYVPAVSIGQVFNYIIKYDKSTGLITMTNNNKLNENQVTETQVETEVETEWYTSNSPYALEEENNYDLGGESPGGSTIDLSKQRYLSMSINVSKKIESEVYIDLNSTTAKEQITELVTLLGHKFNAGKIRSMIESVLVADADPVYVWDFEETYDLKKTYFTIASLRGNKKSMLVRLYNPGAVPLSLKDSKFDPLKPSLKSNKVIKRGVLSFNPFYSTIEEFEAAAISHEPLVLNSTSYSGLHRAYLGPLLIETINAYGLYLSDAEVGLSKFKEIVNKNVSPIGNFREDSIREFSMPNIRSQNILTKAQVEEIATTLKVFNDHSTFVSIGDYLPFGSYKPEDIRKYGLAFTIDSPIKYQFKVELIFQTIDEKITLTGIHIKSGENMFPI